MSLLKLSNLHKAFGPHEVLKGANLEVMRGETAVIIGSSGSGKSTLLRCATLLEIPEAGEIELEDKVLWSSKDTRSHRTAERALARQRANFGFVFQQFNLFPHMTALDNVMEGPITVKRMVRGAARELAMQMLERVGLADKGNRHPSQLSGGEQQRVAIARALAMQPKVLMMDEPTSALDPELVAEVLDVTAELARQGITMLIVTHEMGFAYEVADRLHFLHEGKIVEEGNARQVLRAPSTSVLQSFLRRFHYSMTLFADSEAAIPRGSAKKEPSLP
jgi:ABC-type polar amino acid transport system ATPase subunit